MVSSPLKNISQIIQIGWFPQIGMKIKNIWNHHLDEFTRDNERTSPQKGTIFQKKKNHLPTSGDKSSFSGDFPMHLEHTNIDFLFPCVLPLHNRLCSSWSQQKTRVKRVLPIHKQLIWRSYTNQIDPNGDFMVIQWWFTKSFLSKHRSKTIQQTQLQ